MGQDILCFDEKAKLNFIVWGDPQISSVNPARLKRFTLAVEDVAKAKGTADAIVLAGDITEYGKESEYKSVADALGLAKDKYKKLLCIPGNHDVRLRSYKKQLAKFQSFINSVKPCSELESGHYYHSCRINGFKFIMLGADRASFESAYISDKQLARLESELEAEKESSKPVFVFNHQTLKKMNGLPKTWTGKGDFRGSVGRQSDKIKAIFEKYDNVFFITGHLHFGVNEFTFEERGKLKLLSVPTVAAANHGEYNADGQGYIVSVYDDKIVLRARLFCEGRYVEESVKNAFVEIPIEKFRHISL